MRAEEKAIGEEEALSCRHLLDAISKFTDLPRATGSLGSQSVAEPEPGREARSHGLRLTESPFVQSSLRFCNSGPLLPSFLSCAHEKAPFLASRISCVPTSSRITQEASHRNLAISHLTSRFSLCLRDAEIKCTFFRQSHLSRQRSETTSPERRLILRCPSRRSSNRVRKVCKRIKAPGSFSFIAKSPE